jgi:hypothetical protein
LNNFKKAANAREELQNKYLQQRVDHLEAKLKVAKSELSQNSICLKELEFNIENYNVKKLFQIENGNFATGYGSTKKNLKKMLQKAKKEASFSMRFLINHKLLEKSAPTDEDIQVFAVVIAVLLRIIEYLFLFSVTGRSANRFV